MVGVCVAPRQDAVRLPDFGFNSVFTCVREALVCPNALVLCRKPRRTWFNAGRVLLPLSTIVLFWSLMCVLSICENFSCDVDIYDLKFRIILEV